MIVITSGYILLINKKDSKVEYSPTSKIELPVIEKIDKINTAIDQDIETSFNQFVYTNNGKEAEIIELIIKNTTNETYYFYSPTCASANPYVKYIPPKNIKLETNPIITISPPCNMPSSLHELKPGQSTSFDWNQVNYNYQEKFVQSGEYLMEINLYKEKDNTVKKYSKGKNKFIIKTQKFDIIYQKPNEHIKILSPKKGSFLKSDDNYTIEWQGAKTDEVNIYYGNDWRMNLNPEQKQEIILNIKNTGNYEWRIPNLDTYSYGNDYMIKIEEVGQEGIGYSDIFNFKKVTEIEIIRRIIKKDNSNKYNLASIECHQDKKKYEESQDYNNKNFSSCSIIESRIGYNKKECSPFSMENCYICEFRCE